MKTAAKHAEGFSVSKFAVFAGLAALLAGGAATAAEKSDPAIGVQAQARKGWSLETQVGVFTAFGGSRVASNAQAFTALSLSLDLPGLAPGLSVFLTGGHGANAGSCRDVVRSGSSVSCATWDAPAGVTQRSPEDFSVIPLELGGRYAFVELLPRLTVNGTLALGYSFLTPAITRDAPPGAPHVGFGTGVDYATRIEGLSVGAEVLVRVAVTPLLPSLSAYPRVRYTF
jgi:hypothetical protein